MSSGNMSKLGNILGACDRIRQIRESIGLTQEDLAEKLGVRSSTISRYEKDRLPNPEMLQKIATIGKTTVSWILHGDSQICADPIGAAGQSPATDAPPVEYNKGSSLMARLSQAPARLNPKAADAVPQSEDDLLYDIVVKIEQRLEETSLELSPEDKGVIITHLHQLHRKLAIPVTINTIDTHILLRARPRRPLAPDP